ncbi:hypothetical protein DL93DRAFT_2089981 [Clavulina sp. PMI_390]|nr:hypothetical protein DL93DRAFT_2089981 [Clavulina sp. PMI_390]
MSELWRSEVHFKVLLTRTTERTIGFAQYSYEGSSQGIDDEYSKLEAQINSQHTMIAPLSDTVKLRSQGPLSTFNGLVLAAHIAMYTNGILLHAVRAGKDSEARIGMLKCVDAVLSICETIREYRRFQKVEYGLVVAAYMLIVIRGVARELQHSEARRNTGASTNHCYAIHLFLDVIEDITSSSPAWGKLLARGW